MHSIIHINIWPLTLWSHNRDGTKNDVQVQMLLWYLYFFVIGWDFVIDMLVIKTHLIAVMCIQIINLQKHNFKWSNSSHYCFFYLLRYTKVWVHAWIQRYWSWLPLKKDLRSSSNMQKKIKKALKDPFPEKGYKQKKCLTCYKRKSNLIANHTKTAISMSLRYVLWTRRHLLLVVWIKNAEHVLCFNPNPVPKLPQRLCGAVW